MKLKPIKYLSILIVFAGCKVNKIQQSPSKQIVLDEILVQANANKEPYQPAQTIYADLIHTKLNIEFNWELQQVHGKALLTIKPYDLKKINSVTFDARNFIIHRVSIIQKNDTINLAYQYNNIKLVVGLNQTYCHNDTFKVYISYTAQPNTIANKGGRAISDSKGLYFINPLGKDPNKPKQIWTQGETDFNSCWFPTFDRPNEKHTQEIAITVEDKYTTLSNGELIYSNYHANGTRTDYWKQLQPHAPYLTMIAVGEFALVKDTWRNTMEVNYYVEPKYKPYAKLIFGNTPEMIEFFSKKTGVEYPWSKYSQVVVRDFVSGAMENTSAVVHYEGVAHTDREHEDFDADDIISHELFHHWFGNLVTCKSWSNLPLNESFATYGEYLWHEYKYGKDFADFMFTNNLDYYLKSKNKHKTIPIRYHYSNPVELFDVVSYQKGSRILHLLRNEIGDDAFFKGINIYLTKNKFSTADIHHLRHAMEEASGMDLLLFFNQWFMQAGHPQIFVKYSYNNNILNTIVRQKPTDTTANAYEYKTTFTWGYFRNNVFEIYDTIIYQKNLNDTFNFYLPNAPSFVTFDADAILPAEIIETKPENFWLNQLLYADNHAVKKCAFAQVINFKDSANKATAIHYLINHQAWYFNEMAYDVLEDNKELIPVFLNNILNHAQNHTKASCRASALNAIGSLNDASYKKFFYAALKDKSYNVLSTAITNLLLFDTNTVLKETALLENETNGTISLTLAEIYTDLALPGKNGYFIHNFGKQGLYRNFFIEKYIAYLLTQNLITIENGIDALIAYKHNCSDNNINFYSKRWATKLKSGVNNKFNKEQTSVLIKKINELEKD